MAGPFAEAQYTAPRPCSPPAQRASLARLESFARYHRSELRSPGIGLAPQNKVFLKKKPTSPLQECRL
jgi:hypothetical protein